MKRKRLAAILLAAAFCCMAALTGCGSSVDADATCATLNGNDISLGFMNFAAKYRQAMYDALYMPYFGADYWSQELNEGETFEETVKSEVANNVELMYLLEDHMADYGVEITEEDTEAIKAAAEQFMSDNTRSAKKQMGAKEEYVEELLRLQTIEQRMHDAIYNEEEVELTDEEVAQRTFTYVRVSSTVKSDEDGNSVDLTEDEKKDLKAEMEELDKAAKEDFDAAVEESGRTSNTYSYGADNPGSIGDEVLEVADSLKEGEVSDLIETDAYYFIIRLDSEFDKEATKARREDLEDEQRSAHYEEVCDGYVSEADFELDEDAWAQVKFDKLFSLATNEDTSEDAGDGTSGE